MLRIVRRLRVRPLLMLLMPVLLWTGLTMTSARGGAGEYVFSNITVSSAEDLSHARITYDYGWATAEFPGWQTCTWNVFDASDAVIGESTVDMIGLASSYTDRTKEISVTGIPASADVSCVASNSDELGDYQISDVRVAKRGMGDPREFVLSFDATWDAGGLPSAANCTVVVHDRSGSVLFTEDFSLTTGGSTVNDLTTRVFSPRDIAGPPGAASLSCQPFTG